MSVDHQKTLSVRMTVASRAYRSRVGGLLHTIGLHAGQESVLKALAEQDGQSMTRLATNLGVQPPTVTKMVSRLVAVGFVERRLSDVDGRQAHVFLTPLGRSAIDEIDQMLDRVEREALAGIDDKDQKRLRRLLRQISLNLSGEFGDIEDDEAAA